MRHDALFVAAVVDAVLLAELPKAVPAVLKPLDA
jgi:hypothetical protein